jgi:hypothetical protein
MNQFTCSHYYEFGYRFSGSESMPVFFFILVWYGTGTGSEAQIFQINPIINGMRYRYQESEFWGSRLSRYDTVLFRFSHIEDPELRFD